MEKIKEFYNQYDAKSLLIAEFATALVFAVSFLIK